MLLGLDGVDVTAVQLDEDSNPMLALVTADERDPLLPGLRRAIAAPTFLGAHPSA